MNSVVAELESLEETLAVLACDVFGSETIPELSDADVVALLAVTGRLQRRLEGLQVETVVQVRSAPKGCVTSVSPPRMGAPGRLI